ncbi:MAG: murein biosynthesis integral membrane protein MurJ [Candidatus Omnitrophica bacterium]|nr:murein biosynthesis integral membrane protein MurJ [Candidatus Omnitrophota bacterium]
MSTRSLIKSTGIISLATAASRVLGFIRDILMAYFFGTGGAIQAFFVAFRIPNLLRHMVAEGAANSAFVPVLSEYLVTRKRDEYWHLANVLFNKMLGLLLVVVIIGVLVSPIIVRIIAPGFLTDTGQFALTVNLTRILFPYILLIGLAAYAMGVLNSLKHFWTPALAPALLNLSIIAAILIFRHDVSVTTLAWAILIGGFFQLFIQMPVLYKKGMRLKIGGRLSHVTAKKIGRLLIPRAIGATVYQLNILIDTILASLHWIVGAGGIAALWYSNRLIQLPTAVFGISLATAILPTLSGHFAKNDINSFKKTLNFSLKALFLIMIPATAGFIVLGSHIVRILFQRGEFTAYSTMITSQALIFYSVGLFSYAGIKMLVFSFYSMQDTLTPVKTASLALAMNVVLNLILMWPLKTGGLALATSIAGIFNFLALFYLLKRKIGRFYEEKLALFLIKVIAASALMGLILYLGSRRFDSILLTKGLPFNVSFMVISIAVGVVIYFAILSLLRVRELGKFVKWVLRIQ